MSVWKKRETNGRREVEGKGTNLSIKCLREERSRRTILRVESWRFEICLFGLVGIGLPEDDGRRRSQNERRRSR